MKKFFVIGFAVIALAACDTTEKNEQSTVETETTDTDMMDAPATYTATEGDAMYKDNMVMVYRNGSWVAADSDVTLENGVVVSKQGEVKKDDKVVKLDEGETVSRSGNIFDKAGHGIKEGWDGAKKGVREAGDAIKKAANKVGEETKEIVQ